MSHSSERLADAAPVSFWLDDPRAPAPADPLIGHQRCDLAVVGGGYTGLWTALLAKEADPGDPDINWSGDGHQIPAAAAGN